MSKKTKKQKNNFKLHKAVTHIKLDFANDGKLERLNELGAAFILLVQAYIDHIFDNALKTVSKFDTIPETETRLSARYQRCAWQQAVGIMQSFFSNERENKPVLKNITIQGNANVIKLEKSETSEFDYWLKISTLEKGSPILLPIKIYKYGIEILQSGKLCSGVTLNCKNGKWYASLIVETENKKEEQTGGITGVDLGIKNLLTTTSGHFGQFSDKLVSLVKKNDEKRRRKQKQNACLKKREKPVIPLHNKKLESTIKNEIGRAINNFINSISETTTVVMERLSISDMKFKSKAMNRVLKASKIGYAIDRLKQKLDSKHIHYSTVAAAYTSQGCSKCGYVDKKNRPTQEKFFCKFCEHTENADVNASKNIAKRFGDDELNGLTDFRKVKSFLLERFFKRFPDARSASDGLELGFTLREISGQPLTVNQLI